MASIRSSLPENVNRATELLAVLWTFTTLALIVVLVKVYTRFKIIGETGFDDFLILFSMVYPTLRVSHLTKVAYFSVAFNHLHGPFHSRRKIWNGKTCGLPHSS